MLLRIYNDSSDLIDHSQQFNSSRPAEVVQAKVAQVDAPQADVGGAETAETEVAQAVTAVDVSKPSDEGAE